MRSYSVDHSMTLMRSDAVVLLDTYSRRLLLFISNVNHSAAARDCVGRLWVYEKACM